MAKHIMLATFFNHEAITLAITKLNLDKIILLVDKKPNPDLEKNLGFIKDTFGKVLDIQIKKIEDYDVVSIAETSVKIIDDIDTDDFIYVNVTAGRKTNAIALMLASYARHKRIDRIVYYPEDMKKVIYLPRLSFNLTKSQKLILDNIDKKKFSNYSELAEKLELSRAILYRAIDELKNMDLLTTDDGLKLTDAGKIVRL